MAIHNQVVTVSSTSYPAITAPQVSPGFAGAVSVARESGTPIVAVSFDGVNDHGRLVDGVIAAINFDRPYPAVWLRLIAAGSANVQVIVESRG